MAITANTFETFQSEGKREDLSDIIYNIDPTECPFMMMAGRGKAKAKYHEWQTDVLDTPVNNNAVFESDNPTFPAITATVRPGNYTQISDKALAVSGTQEVVDKAGRKSEIAYQLSRQAKSLKRDLETQMCDNLPSRAGVSDTTARQSGSLRAWIATNDNMGTGGTSGGFSAGIVAAAGDATGNQRAFLESDLKSVIADAWNSGGDPTVILVGKFNKRVASGFTGNSTRFDRGEDQKLFAGIDYYVSDFGEHKVVPSRFTTERNAYVLTPKLWSVDYLRPFFQHALAKTGDAEKRQLLVEYTLRASNEAGSGVVADLTTS
jgi:hypothetical protein